MKRSAPPIESIDDSSDASNDTVQPSGPSSATAMKKVAAKVAKVVQEPPRVSQPKKPSSSPAGISTQDQTKVQLTLSSTSNSISPMSQLPQALPVKVEQGSPRVPAPQLSLPQSFLEMTAPHEEVFQLATIMCPNSRFVADVEHELRATYKLNFEQLWKEKKQTILVAYIKKLWDEDLEELKQLTANWPTEIEAREIKLILMRREPQHSEDTESSFTTATSDQAQPRQQQSSIKKEENVSEEMSLIFDEDGVLLLPDEVFINIFRFLDSATRENVGLACTRFNELLCQLERDRNPLDLRLSQISDDETFASIVSTRRRFSDLAINLDSRPMLPSSERIKKIVAKFGPRLKKFKFWASLRSSSEVTETQLVDLLRLLPNVEEIALLRIQVMPDVNMLKLLTEFEMTKLKKLLLDECIFGRPLVLECFPENVLQELVLLFNKPQFQALLNRQAKIKKLGMFRNDLLKFDHLALEHLRISSDIDLALVIRQQPKLRYLDFNFSSIKDEVFAALCELKHLQVLRTNIDMVSSHAFKSLQELTHLKELRIRSNKFGDSRHLLELSMMKSMQLEKLTLVFAGSKIPQEILIQIGNNFRHLKHLELINRSIQIINTALENFPNLESLLLDFGLVIGGQEDKFIINEDFPGHKKLKQLVVTRVRRFSTNVSTKSLLKLVTKCPNLERIMLPLSNVKWEDLLNVIENTKKLTHLGMEFDAFNFSKAIESIQASKSLRYVRLKGVYKVPKDAALRIFFEAQFPSIKHIDHTHTNINGDVIMKKRNEPEWSFNLLDFS